MIEGLLKKFQAERGLTALRQDELFETFAAHCVVNQFYEEDFDPDHLRMGHGGDLGIDAAAIIVNGDLFTESAEVRDAVAGAREIRVHFVIVQAKSSPRFEAKVFTDLADNLHHVFAAKALTYQCSDAVRDLRTSIESVYGDLQKLARELPRLSVWYVATGDSDDSFLGSKRTAAADRLEKTGLFHSVIFKHVGAKELARLYQRSSDVASAVFAMPKRIAMPKIPGVRQAFLGVLPAGQFVRDVITDTAGGIRKSLFYENVRDFQDYNTVNVEIQRTLRDVERRERFAVLNNGITIVTRQLTTAGDDIHIRDFQIVNGCQTCHVLFDEHASLSEGVFVNVRLIESVEDDVISGIITATNRQTAITDDDLMARDEFHKRLEAYFSNQPKERRLYYERRSKQYAARPDVEKTRIITRAQMARAYVAMFLDEPSGVGRYRQLAESRSSELFQPAHDLLLYYASSSAIYRLEWLWRNRRLPTAYAPARYHMLAGLRLLVTGSDQLPRNARGLSAICDKVLETVWNQATAERRFKTLVQPLHHAMEAESTPNPLLGDLVRTKRFGDNFKMAVLSLRRRRK
jgi:hypothetical protein